MAKLPVAGVRTPFDLPGLDLWLRTDDGSKFVPANPVNGQGLGTWRSSDTAHAYPFAGTGSPTFQTNVVGGKSVVRFNGINQGFRVGGSPSSLKNVSGASIFAVVSRSNATLAGIILDLLHPSSGPRLNLVSNFLIAGNPRGGHSRLDTDAVTQSGQSDNIGMVLNQFYILSFLVDYAHGMGNFFVNGVKTQPSGINTSSMGNTSNTNLLNISIASRDLSTNWFGGDIAEIILYNRLLTRYEARSIELYLDNRFSLSVFTKTRTGAEARTLAGTRTLAGARSTA